MFKKTGTKMVDLKSEHVAEVITAIEHILIFRATPG